eukprot:TRINITY_DN27153_c0_g1_i1.p1 TRINITY_DN27153_c0_g1~~TRINITY_DN27153_c0_g1_i1.p1  ORF type:complete len:207 (+),score=39.22 TRINITY_DN27153_c0_g1_i1:81-701(+)
MGAGMCCSGQRGYPKSLDMAGWISDSKSHVDEAIDSEISEIFELAGIDEGSFSLSAEEVGALVHILEDRGFDINETALSRASPAMERSDFEAFVVCLFRRRQDSIQKIVYRSDEVRDVIEAAWELRCEGGTLASLQSDDLFNTVDGIAARSRLTTPLRAEVLQQVHLFELDIAGVVLERGEYECLAENLIVDLLFLSRSRRMRRKG